MRSVKELAEKFSIVELIDISDDRSLTTHGSKYDIAGTIWSTLEATAKPYAAEKIVMIKSKKR